MSNFRLMFKLSRETRTRPSFSQKQKSRVEIINTAFKFYSGWLA
jgi:hypothetical protein